MLPPPLLFRPATKSFQNFKSKVLDNVKSEINRVTMYTMKCSYIKRQDGCRDTCELKVCTTKKPENPSVFLTLPVAHELSVLCMI